MRTTGGEHPYAWVARELEGTPFERIRYEEETGSTNADAAALLGVQDQGGLTIVAERQRGGLGRKGRSWIALPGTALLCTTILPRTAAAGALWAVPYWTALAVQAALASCGIGAALVWPNDLLLAGRKLGGILCQSRIVGSAAWVACGVGINVRRLPGAGKGIDPPPAFCDDVSPIDRPRLLRAVLAEYAGALDLLDRPERIAAQWESAAGLPGARYRILKDRATQPFEATAVALADGGGLIVEHDDSTRETIALADARALR